MTNKMILKETDIDLVGAFECTIENNLILCTGDCFSSEPPHDIADMYAFNVWDAAQGIITGSIAVLFVQTDNGIEFRYKKDKFEVISVSFDLITLRKDNIDYFIRRTNLIR